LIKLRLMDKMQLDIGGAQKIESVIHCKITGKIVFKYL
jgi:hypothetical protein